MVREKPLLQKFSFYALALVVFLAISFVLPSNLLVDFWARDLPPLTGGLKLLYHVLIFLLCVHAYWERKPAGDSPMQAPYMYQHSNPLVFCPQGLMKYLGIIHWANFNTLTIIRNVMLVAWFCTAIGFGGRVSSVINGICWILLHGYVVGMKGVNHRWYVAMYAMIILSLSNTAEFSLDNFIHSKLDWWPFFYEKSEEMWGSLARKFIAFGAMMTLQGGAFAKLRNTGLSWGDGITLQYYCQRDEGVWNGLRLFTLNNRAFAFLLATGSLVLEGVSILVLFNDQVRTIIFFMALGMHVGIYFVMYPSYGPQSVTYFLCVSWAWGYEGISASLPASSNLIVATRLVNTFCLFLLCISWCLLEWWPLTGVPMYSFNREGYQQSHLRDLKQAAEVSKEYVNSCYPWPIAWSMYWIELRITADKKYKTAEVISLLPTNRRFLAKHLRRILHKVAAIQIYTQTFTKSKNCVAKEFLEILSSYLQKYSYNWLSSQNSSPSLELVVLLKDGPHLLHSIPIPKSPFDKEPRHLGLWINDLEKDLLKTVTL